MSGKKKKKSKKKSGLLRKFMSFLLKILLVILIAMGAAIWFVDSKMKNTKRENIDKSQISLSENQNLTQYRNIAVFGIDSRSNSYEKSARSDCIMIVSINTRTHDVKVISIYRDTYLKIDGHGLNKITHAYSYGGAPLAIKTLNENLDLNISDFVTVNFNAVADAVDALGGIELEVTSNEINNINKYITETSKITGKKSKLLTKSGKNNLDGVQAVAYSRIRNTAGGDYKRTERIRNVVEAMIEKLKTKNIIEINNIADKILPEIYTNLSTTDILSLVPYIAKFNITQSNGWPYKVKGATIDDVWYAAPNTLESNVKKLHEEIFEDENYEVPEDIKTISKKIKNNTEK